MRRRRRVVSNEKSNNMFLIGKRKTVRSSQLNCTKYYNNLMHCECDLLYELSINLGFV